MAGGAQVNALGGINTLPQIPAAFFIGDSDGFPGSYSFQHGGCGTRLVEQICVDGDSLEDAVDSILGYPSTVAIGNILARLLPMAHPVFRWCYALAITDAHGLGPLTKHANGYGTFERWRLSVTYESPPYLVLAD